MPVDKVECPFKIKDFITQELVSNSYLDGYSVGEPVFKDSKPYDACDIRYHSECVGEERCPIYTKPKSSVDWRCPVCYTEHDGMSRRCTCGYVKDW